MAIHAAPPPALRLCGAAPGTRRPLPGSSARPLFPGRRRTALARAKEEDEREWVDGPRLIVDALAVYTTAHASERIPQGQEPMVCATLIASWVACAWLRRDYTPDGPERELVWAPGGPMASGLVGGLKTWLVFAPLATAAWCATATALEFDVGTAQVPPPAGWAPPVLEVIEAVAIICPVARGVLATLWMY